MTNRSWSNRGEGFYAFTYTGKFNSTALYSDDYGDKWQLSPSVLRTPTPNITTILGAVEPVVLELKDGRVWMLIRTQMGRFYESFSADGVEWSRPRPTEIISSDSPAGLIHVKDGRILLIWNNCLRFPYAYGGRHVLHAAVSADEGHTWRGYREIVRDPNRLEPSPPSGDHGVSYVNHLGSVVAIIGKLQSFFMGPICAFFTLGVISKRANSGGVVIGALAGFVATVWVANFTSISWLWWIVVGFLVSMGVGWVGSWFFTKPENVQVAQYTIRT